MCAPHSLKLGSVGLDQLEMILLPLLGWAGGSIWQCFWLSQLENATSD